MSDYDSRYRLILPLLASYVANYWF